MRALGSVLLFVGFLTGAFTAVIERDAIPWRYYAIGVGAMGAGIVCLRRSRRGEQQSTARGTQHLQQLETSLRNLVEKVAAMNEGTLEDEEVFAVRHRLDDELMDDLNQFVDVRETMIDRLGIQHYADIMSSFAGAERMLHRAWSASADGYIDEVRLALRSAEEQMRRARQQFQEARARHADPAVLSHSDGNG